jgi:hypothetical protein
MFLIFVAFLSVAAPAHAADRTVQKLMLGGAKPLEVWITRADAADGGLVVKVIAKGVGPRPQAITIYSGGGDDDGPGTGEVKALAGKIMEIPSVGKVLRVDFSYQIPGTAEEQTETTLIGFGGKTHKLLELVTKKTHTRNKNCKEVWDTQISGEGDELDGQVVALRKLKVIPVRGDDDEPLDQGCVPLKAERKAYRWTGDHFADPSAKAEPSPSPGPAAPPAEAPSED